MRRKIETLILLEVHANDTHSFLMKHEIDSMDSYDWVSQARLYWRNEAVCVEVGSACLPYANGMCAIDSNGILLASEDRVHALSLVYTLTPHCTACVAEYLGVRERLVISAITDKCFLCLSQAVELCMGLTAQGPAGTGKTESCKDFGCMVGQWTVVMNCSDGLDYLALAKLFQGLAITGAWGCFDEFNRISVEALAVAGAYLGVITGSWRARRDRCEFDGTEIPIKHSMGYCFTMNPGYAGRSEMPDSLKVHLRVVTMYVPERRLIIKVKLTGAGFRHAAMLSSKFHYLYVLCEFALSKQAQYDFGLRNILAVLRSAGQRKRAERGISESTVLLRTLLDVNLSRLVPEDVPLFYGFLDDIFPGVKVDRAKNPAIEATLSKTLRMLRLQPKEQWVDRLLQLYEVLLQRHSIFLLGPSGSGKSSMLESLRHTLHAMRPAEAAPPSWGQQHILCRINPKALLVGQLHGQFDPTSHEWTDGTFSTLFRRACCNKQAFTWLCFDGPIDAAWVENLNTVMDDNKKLCLMSGEIIPMLRPNVTLLFEVENLNCASPATVSRAGIISASEEDLGWKPMVQSWLDGQLATAGDGVGVGGDSAYRAAPPESELAALADLLLLRSSIFVDGIMRNGVIEQPSVFQFLAAECSSTMACTVIGGQSRSLLTLLGALLVDARREVAPLNEIVLERLVLYSTIWSVAGTLKGSDRPRLDQYLRTRTDVLPTLKHSTEDTCYDFFIDATGQWAHWKSALPEWQAPPSAIPPRGSIAQEFSSLFVPSLDSVRIEHIMALSARYGRATLITGASGSGKSVVMRQYLEAANTPKTCSSAMALSSLTTTISMHHSIMGLLEKRQGTTYGPPGGRRMLLFIDEMGSSPLNEWGEQPALEVVRQLAEFHELCNLSKPGEIMAIRDVILLGVAAHPGGGRHDLPNRLKRHCQMVELVMPSKASIAYIYGTLLSAHWSSYDVELHDLRLDQLITLTYALWEKLCATMLPTPAKFHYVFSVRDLSRVFEGICMCDLKACLRPDVARAALAGSASPGRRALTRNPTFSSMRGGSGVVGPIAARTMLLHLWRHECSRVFADRLVDEQDKSRFAAAIDDVLGSVPGYRGGGVGTGAGGDGTGGGGFLFGNFLRDSPDEATTGEMQAPPNVYEPLQNGLAECRERVSYFVERYNSATPWGAPLDLALFDDALLHFMRVCRILRMPRGSALLVGVDGSGKQTLARLAAFVGGIRIYQPRVTQAYVVADLLDEFKRRHAEAGVHASPVALLFTERELREDTFFELVNSFLATGELPSLFNADEIKGLYAQLQGPYKESPFHQVNVQPTNAELYTFFADRVRSNLHIVLCFSPAGNKLREKARLFLQLSMLARSTGSGCGPRARSPRSRSAFSALIALRCRATRPRHCAPSSWHTWGGSSLSCGGCSAASSRGPVDTPT